jgi:hypothetical protein
MVPSRVDSPFDERKCRPANLTRAERPATFTLIGFYASELIRLPQPPNS